MIFYAIIFLNVLIYLLEFLVGKSVFINNFALYYGSDFYTFFTYSFLHGDFEHIFMNMVMLFMLSQILRFLNIKHLLIVYFVGAIISSLGYYYLMINMGYYNFILLGASGAISALMGYAAIVLRQNGFLIAIVVTSIISAVIFQNIAWQAHIFGAIFGIIYAYGVYFLRR